MRACYRTDKGLIRPTNQDTLLIAENLFGVADGMGGHNGGETASYVAARVVQLALKGHLPQPELLKASVEAANHRVFEMQRHDAELRGMGTTMSVLWYGGKSAYVAQVGDSRVYLYRQNQLQQITHDHSYVQELVDLGVITQEEARVHPQRNMITRAVGIDKKVEVDLFTIDLCDGDRILICSDGLYGLVDDKTMETIIGESQNEEEAAEQLLAAALEAGGTDNITLILCGEEAVPSCKEG